MRSRTRECSATRLTSSDRILKADLGGDIVERVNLNLPAADRARLKRLAARTCKAEAELARELLLRALSEVEREELVREVRASRSPERRKRDLTIARAIERVRGAAR